MPSTHHPAAKAAAAKRYIPQLSDSLHPLAAEVGRAIASEVRLIGSDCHPTEAIPRQGRSRQRGETKNVPELCIRMDGLEDRMAQLVVQVLERSLRSDSTDGTALRMALIANLANAEIGRDAPSRPGPGLALGTDALMTTAAAAAMLEVSRPYVSMLCDAGKLGEVVMTEGGHRRIRSSAVEAYLNERVRQATEATSPREAGVEAGLYDRPDSAYKAVRRGAGNKAGAGKTGVEKAPVEKATSARKPRS